MNDLLFTASGELSTLFSSRISDLKSEVESMDSDYLLKVSAADLRDYLINRYSWTTIQLRDDDIYQHEAEDADVSAGWPRDRISGSTVKGTLITVCIPFDGPAALFRYRPSQYNFHPPRGRIVQTEIQLRYRFHRKDTRHLDQELDDDLASIRDYVMWINHDISQFNSSLERKAQIATQDRKSKILADRATSAALGIPIRRREDAPATFAAPTIRRKARIERPRVPEDEPFEPEPILDQEEYEHILRIMQNMTLVMERSPRAFSEMREEDLRQHFLVQLNGHYEGQATGETFNFHGKTDILIRIDGRNVFIAECKIWNGPNALKHTIDQLLGYTSWRDTKTAIVVFNRDTCFTTVLAKIPKTMEAHPGFKRQVGIEESTVFRYVFHRPGDLNRELYLTVMAFDIPQPNLP